MSVFLSCGFLLSSFTTGPNQAGFSSGEAVQADPAIWGISIASAVLVLVNVILLLLSASKGHDARKDLDRIGNLLEEDETP